jgi:DNA-binding GntR family transcriptional regulator
MAKHKSLRQVSHTRLSDQAYEVLRDSIIRRELPSGHRLDLEDLKQQLGISQTPLKEAINRLATEGLITIVPRRGSYVAELTAKDAAERFEVRQLLEIGIARDIIARLTDDHLNHLRRVYDDLKTISGPGKLDSDYFTFLEKDREFHRAMISIAGNNLLLEIYDSLNIYLEMAKVFYLAEDKRLQLVDHEHRQILTALEARDVEALKQALADHIQSAKRVVVPGIAMERTYAIDDKELISEPVAVDSGDGYRLLS